MSIIFALLGDMLHSSVLFSALLGSTSAITSTSSPSYIVLFDNLRSIDFTCFSGGTGTTDLNTAYSVISVFTISLLVKSGSPA